MFLNHLLSRAWVVPLAAAASAQGLVTNHDPSSVKQIAVIGAGAAGSSAAFHLSRFAEADGVPVNVTVFERTNRVGGRTLTVNVFDDPQMPLELGASIFVRANRIMYDAANEFGLSLGGYGGDRLMMIWDGDRFVFESDSADSWWWELGKMVWRYGLAPIRLKRLRDSTVDTFLKMYEAPHFPFRSLTGTVLDLGLEAATSITGEEMLANAGVGKDFSKDIVQAATRVNYASNLRSIHGLETMVSMAAEGAMSVRGGNWQVFATMLERCNTTCAVLKETAVSSIACATKDNASSTKYLVSTHAASDAADAAEEYPVAFDSVIVATPWQYAGISAGGLLEQPIEEIKYTRLHVTLFTSPLKLAPAYFGLAEDAKVPTSVLTTLTPDGDDKPEFISVSTVGGYRNPATGADEFAYKIFSLEKVTPEFLSRILGADVPDQFTKKSSSGKEGGEDASGPISWYFPHVFHSYPILDTRVAFQDPVLGDGLYYTSGIESFISTMETSALMGRNVARLALDDLAAAKKTAPESLESPAGPGEAQEQHILGTRLGEVGEL